MVASGEDNITKYLSFVKKNLRNRSRKTEARQTFVMNFWLLIRNKALKKLYFS